MTDLKNFLNIKGGTRGLLLAVGLLLILMAHAQDWVAAKLHENFLPIEPYVSPLMKAVGDYGYASGLSFIFMAVFLWIGAILFNRFWELYVRPSLDKHLNKLEDELDKTRKETRELLSKSALEIAVARCDSEEVRRNLKMIHTVAFGSHCDSVNSLYHALSANVGKYLDAQEPHRSNHHQEILIEEYSDGLVKWNETTSWDFHTISEDGEYSTPVKNGGVSHLFKYETTAKYKNLEDVSIDIKIDGSVIFSLNDSVTITRGDDDNIIGFDSKIPDLVISDSGKGEMTFTFKRIIAIDKGKVRVSIKEVSYIEDDYFFAHRAVPTCGATVSISIPQNWRFDFFIVPPNEGWDMNEDVDFKRTARTTGWVLPGIITCCKWARR